MAATKNLDLGLAVINSYCLSNTPLQLQKNLNKTLFYIPNAETKISYKYMSVTVAYNFAFIISLPLMKYC